MLDLIEAFMKPQFMVMLLASIATFVTVLTIALPVLQKDRMGQRMKLMATERDKMRVMEGLEGVSGGQPFDRAAMEQTIAGLGKRVFLMHSVHEAGPITFETRWTLSYLAGPMTREQIRQVTGAQSAGAATQGAAPAATLAAASSPANAVGTAAASSTPPVLPPDVPQYFLTPSHASGDVMYTPAVLGLADVHFANAKLGIAEQRRVALISHLHHLHVGPPRRHVLADARRCAAPSSPPARR